MPRPLKAVLEILNPTLEIIKKKKLLWKSLWKLLKTPQNAGNYTECWKLLSEFWVAAVAAPRPPKAAQIKLPNLKVAFAKIPKSKAKSKK